MKPAEIAKNIKDASHIVAHLDSEKKNKVLYTLHDLISKNTDYIISENKKDILNAENAGLQKSLIERLKIDGKVIKEMQSSIEDVIGLPDPVGEVTKLSKRPNGLLVGKMRVPIGVILIIYESRPNVTVDAFSLCLKSGNCAILKGGSEAVHSNIALFNLITESLQS